MKPICVILSGGLMACGVVGCKTTDQAETPADPYGGYSTTDGGGYGGAQHDYVQVTPTGQSSGSTYGQAGSQASSWDAGGGYTASAPSGSGGTYYDSGPVDQGGAYSTVGGAAAVSNEIASPAPSSYTPPSGTTYTVKKGDTLYRIGLNHGTTANAIMAANGISGSTIHPGQVLQIP